MRAVGLLFLYAVLVLSFYTNSTLLTPPDFRVDVCEECVRYTISWTVTDVDPPEWVKPKRSFLRKLLNFLYT